MKGFFIFVYMLIIDNHYPYPIHIVHSDCNALGFSVRYPIPFAAAVKERNAMEIRYLQLYFSKMEYFPC